MVITHFLTEITFHNFQPQESLQLLQPPPEKQDLRLLGQSYTSPKENRLNSENKETPKIFWMDLESIMSYFFWGGQQKSHTQTHTHG